MNAQEHCNKSVTMETEDVNTTEADSSSMKAATESINYQWGALGYHQYIKSACLKEIKEIKQERIHYSGKDTIPALTPV